MPAGAPGWDCGGKFQIAAEAPAETPSAVTAVAANTARRFLICASISDRLDVPRFSSLSGGSQPDSVQCMGEVPVRPAIPVSIALRFTGSRARKCAFAADKRPLKLPRRADDIAHMTNDASRPSLGRLLVERGVITEEQLNTALRVQRDEGGMLGEILTSRGWVTPLSIAAAVAKQKADEPPPSVEQNNRPGRGASWKPLGTLLVEKGFISDVQLKQALALQRDGGGFLGEILVDNGWLAASDLVLALAAQLGLDFDVKRAVAQRDEAVILPADRPAAHFEVLEDVAGEPQLLKTTETFMEATDFVFDEVLWQREPGGLQIVRVDGGRREVVWSFRPGEAATHAREDMLSVFGYAVGQWEDKHQRGPEGPSVAALG